MKRRPVPFSMHAQRLSLPSFVIKRWQEICPQKSPISAPCVDKWREDKQI